MTWSLLCPTRDRHESRERLLKSLSDTIQNKKEVEILFGVDKDDDKTQEHINLQISKFPDLNIKMLVRNRSIFINRDYYNWLGGFADGEFMWVIGDDLVFLQPQWDTFIFTNINTYLVDKTDRIVCVAARDNTPSPSQNIEKYPCFPIISRNAMKVLGFILHPNIPTWGADYALKILYQGAGRLLYVDDNRVFINHVSYHTKQVPEDKLNIRVGTIFNQLKMIPIYNIDRIVAEEVPQQIQILKEAIYKRTPINEQIFK